MIHIPHLGASSHAHHCKSMITNCFSGQATERHGDGKNRVIGTYFYAAVAFGELFTAKNLFRSRKPTPLGYCRQPAFI